MDSSVLNQYTVKLVSPNNKGFPILVYPNFKNKFSYISVTDEASDFKFGKLSSFTKAYHKISRRKSGCWPGLGELPKILGFPFNISAKINGSDLNIGGRWALPRPITKSHPVENVGVGAT